MAKSRCEAWVVASRYMHTITPSRSVLNRREGYGTGADVRGGIKVSYREYNLVLLDL